MAIDKHTFESNQTGTRLEQVKKFLKDNPDKAFTIVEIANAIGIVSANNLASCLKNLEYHGFIKRKKLGKVIYNIWDRQNDTS